MSKLIALLIVILFIGSWVLLNQATATEVKTVIFIYKETLPGQELFIKGGHDAGLVVAGLYPQLAESINYLNRLNPETAALKRHDTTLDWFSDSVLEWTTDKWPDDWGEVKTYSEHGFGEDVDNQWGPHWWKFEVTMPGEVGEWFEFKAFMREKDQAWWENDIHQDNAPYNTVNHWAKKGYLTRVRFNDSWITETPLVTLPVDQPPVADFTVEPVEGNIETEFKVDAAQALDAEDGEQIQLRWDWEHDGHYDTQWRTQKTATHRYAEVGQKNIQLEVRDRQGQTDKKILSVGVLNTPPIAEFTLEPTLGTTQTDFKVNASISSDLEDKTALQVRWDWENDGIYDTDWSFTKTATVRYDSSGLKTIQLQVQDSGNLITTQRHPLQVKEAVIRHYHPGYYSNQLGANLYANGVEFSIWAPKAQQVKVKIVHKKNTQTRHLTPLTADYNQGIWWVFVPKITAGAEYKFLLNQDTELPDPYAHYNRYSNGNSVVVDHSFPWTDEHWQRPAWQDYIIYELHVKDFTSADEDVRTTYRGKYLGIIDKIPYLQKLGISALELMPIAEFPDSGYSWGYNPSLYLAPESSYAVEPTQGQSGVDELKTLINAAHEAGIAVILDLVFNHTSNTDNWLWIIDHEAYFEGNTPWGNRLDTAHPMVKRLGKDAIELFMKHYHVDGFRFDATGNGWIDYTFLFELKNHAVSIDPNVLFIYENLPNNPELKTWGAQWSDGFHDNGVALLCGWNNVTASLFAKHIYFSRDEGWAASPVEAVNYLESHDEDTLAHLLEIAGFGPEAQRWKTRLGAVMLSTSLGLPMIWMGQEFLRNRAGQDIREQPLNWQQLEQNRDIYDYYAGLLRLRRAHPALRLVKHTQGFRWQYAPWESGHDANVIGYSLQTTHPDDKKFVVLLNFNSSPRTINLGFPEAGIWTQVVTETQAANETTLRVEGYQYKVTIEGSSGIIFMK